MKDTALQIFQYEGDGLEAMINEKGEIWFVAADVCKILDIKNVSDAVEKLEDDEKLLSPRTIAGQQRNVLWINEPGFYRLIFRSDKSDAKKIQHWTFHEVLPAIRKTGSYPVNQQVLQGPSKQGSIEESMDRFTAELSALRQQMEAIAPNQKRKPGQVQRSELPHKVSRTERRALKYDDYSDASIKARCLMSLLKLSPGWHDRREVLNVGDPVLGVLGLQYTGGVLNVLSRDGLLLRRGGNGHNALYRLRD